MVQGQSLCFCCRLILRRRDIPAPRRPEVSLALYRAFYDDGKKFRSPHFKNQVSFFFVSLTTYFISGCRGRSYSRRRRKRSCNAWAVASAKNISSPAFTNKRKLSGDSCDVLRERIRSGACFNLEEFGVPFSEVVCGLQIN